MKATTKATEFKKAIKAALALQRLSDPKTKKKDEQPIPMKGRLTVTEKGLFVESTFLGAYVKLAVPATVMRPGRAYVELDSISKLRLSGELTLDAQNDADQIEISNKKSKFNLALDTDSEDLFKTAQPDITNLKAVVKLPTAMLAAAASMVELKHILKVDDLRMQFQFRRGKKANRLDICGIDFFSYARFVRISPTVKVRTSTKFILKPTALGRILDSVTAKEVVISVHTRAEEEMASMVRFQTEDADVFYPTLDLPFQDAEQAYQSTIAGVCDSKFSVKRKDMMEALNDIKSVSSDSTPLVLNIRVTPKKVQMAARQEKNKALSTIPSERIELGDGEPHIIYVNQLYFTEVVALAPDVAPLRIESWNRAQIIVRAENIQDGTIEYYLSQVDLQKHREDVESSRD